MGLLCKITLFFLAALLHLNASAKQNVVLILADDMSPDLSMLGTSGIQTPHIDALAREGVYFHNAFAASGSCSPSRTAILTGMWPHSSGNWRNVVAPPLDLSDKDFSRETSFIDKVGISDHVETLPEIFKANGYFTAITQKLHLSPAWRYPYDARNPVQSNPAVFKKTIHEFIEGAGDKPFFFQINVAAPHRSYRKHLAQNPDHELPLASSIIVPAFLPDVPGVRRDMQEYYACVEIVDSCVGEILEALDEAGIRDDTLIFFTSDQGMPIHFAKASAYPTGIRIPLAVVGPGIVKGQTNYAAVSHVDFAPTILDYCGIDIPETMQGQSLRPILSGGDGIDGRQHVFAEHNSHGSNPSEFYPQRVATDGDWYYILNLDPNKVQRLPADLRGVKNWDNHSYDSIIEAKNSHPKEYAYLTLFDKPRAPEHLYRISKDKWGINDLAGHPAHQEVLKEMRAVLANWRESTDDIESSPLEIAEQPYAKVP